MEARTHEERGRQVVRLEGDVDLESSPRAREALLAAVERGQDVVVDLSGAHYVDSSGIASLVEAFLAARDRGTRLLVAAPAPGTMRVLALARLDGVFPIVATVEEGLAGG